MTPLDHRIATVRGVLLRRRFVGALAWTAAAGGAAVAGTVVVGRAMGWEPPSGGRLAAMAGAAAILTAMGWAWRRRPDRRESAMALDAACGTKEMFATALHAREQTDPFSRATVAAAEKEAESVDSRKKFPWRTPRHIRWTAAGVLAAGLAIWLMPTLDLFGHAEARQVAEVGRKRVEQTQESARQAIAQVQSLPVDAAGNERIENAKRELEALIANPPADPAVAQRTALKALREIQEELRRKVETDRDVANARRDRRTYSAMRPPTDQTGAVADAKRKLAQGDYGGAAGEIGRIEREYGDQSPADKSRSAKEMGELADQLDRRAGESGGQEGLERQLGQTGASDAEAKELADAMRGSAAGDESVGKRAGELKDRIAGRMNGGKGATAEQKARLDRMMTDAQSQADQMERGKRLAEGARKMAEGMKKGAEAGADAKAAEKQVAEGAQGLKSQLGGMAARSDRAEKLAEAEKRAGQAADAQARAVNESGDPKQTQAGDSENAQANAQGKQGGQEGKEGQSGQAGADGKQVGTDQGQGKRPGGEDGQGAKEGGNDSGGGEKSGGEKSGGEKAGGEKPGGEKSGDGKSDGGKDGGGKEPGSPGQGDSAGGQEGGKDRGSGAGEGEAEGSGGRAPGGEDGSAGDGTQAGGGGAGQGSGQRDRADAAPGKFVPENALTKDQEGGEALAGSYVEADTVKGESKAALRDAVKSAQSRQTDEVEQERVTGQGESVVKEYFSSMEKDAK